MVRLCLSRAVLVAPNPRGVPPTNSRLTAPQVTVDVYAKKLKKEQVAVAFGESHLTVTINDTDGQEEYKLDVELYGKVGGKERVAGTTSYRKEGRASWQGTVCHVKPHGHTDTRNAFNPGCNTHVHTCTGHPGAVQVRGAVHQT